MQNASEKRIALLNILSSKFVRKKVCGIIRDLKWVIRNNKTRFQNLLP